MDSKGDCQHSASDSDSESELNKRLVDMGEDVLTGREALRACCPDLPQDSQPAGGEHAGPGTRGNHSLAFGQNALNT